VSDGDSIYDSWETGGIDVDGGGDDLDLQALGADFRGVPIELDPQRKDILDEIDYFDCAVGGGDCPPGDGHSHRPDAGALTTIVDIFATAPVSNPDGTNGINLWVVVDEDLPHQMKCDLDAACFDVIKAAQAGTFMHELGHNLGLCHGGGDDINCKLEAKGKDLALLRLREQVGKFAPDLAQSIGWPRRRAMPVHSASAASTACSSVMAQPAAQAACQASGSS
jgi:hypothetical protein